MIQGPGTGEAAGSRRRVYELTIAKGGLKAPRAAGTCTPVDWNTPLPDQFQNQTQKHCIDRETRRGPSVLVQLDAVSIAAFTKFFLSGWTARSSTKPASPGYLTLIWNTHPISPT